MKKYRIFPVLMCLLATCCFTACSDDDDEDGGASNVETCYFESQGERIDFKYAYYYHEPYDDGDDEISVEFSSIDILDYYYHPEKVKPGIYFSTAVIDFAGTNQIPLGEIKSDIIRSGSGSGYEEDDELNFSMEVDTKVDLYELVMNGGETESDAPWYSDDYYNEKHSILSVSKAGNGYKMETKELYLLYDATGEGIGYDNPKCTGKFCFVGSLKDISDLAMDEGAASVRAVQVTDPAQIAFLKRLRRSK